MRCQIYLKTGTLAGCSRLSARRLTAPVLLTAFCLFENVAILTRLELYDRARRIINSSGASAKLFTRRFNVQAHNFKQSQAFGPDEARKC